MKEVRYMISDASKRLSIEPHVLRYWEEELELDIPRNELGHRYYREEDLMMLENIKAFKEQGFQLKAIKMLLPNMENAEEILQNKSEIINENENRLMENEYQSIQLNKSNDDKMAKFQMIMKSMFLDVLEDNNKVISETVSEYVIKQMDYLLRMKEEREEDRFRKLDETIREFQKMRQEVAVTKHKKITSLFKRK